MNKPLNNQEISEPSEPSGVTIVLMVALSEEFDVVKERFDVIGDESTERHIRLVLDIGTPGFRAVAVLAENMGAMSAIESADEALADLSPDLVVCIGHSGGLSDDVALGDVCVSNAILDVLHNAKVGEIRGRTQIRFSPRHYDVAAALAASALFVRNHPTLTALYRQWQVEAEKRASDANLPARIPEIFLGPVVCGPVVSNAAVREELKRVDRKALALDTESGGIFNRLEKKGVLGLSIRGIADFADGNKAKLEKESKGQARRLAVENAVEFLKLQLKNPKFMGVAKRAFDEKHSLIPGLFPAQPSVDVVAETEREIMRQLEGCDLRHKPPGFQLPLPRVRAISYLEDLSGKDLDAPQDLTDALRASTRMLVRLPRSFPSQTIGWALAHSLIRQQIDGKPVIPVVVPGDQLKRPRHGFESFVLQGAEGSLNTQLFTPVFIIEEPPFENRARMKFLLEECEKTAHRVLVLTKTEDRISSMDAVITAGDFDEFELAPISFTETAAYLERAFDMLPGEAESVAIKIDETFRKFRLDVHPTYFAGLQEDTIASIISANKRAELIQLAVAGLLSLIVAADKSVPRLARTTRERFLRRLAVFSNVDQSGCSDENLMQLASDFLKENEFSIPTSVFVAPFFGSGLLYKSGDRIYFSHPYLESYLVSEALREDEQMALSYFSPSREIFDFYSFDLYCERGPHDSVLKALEAHAGTALDSWDGKDRHVFLEKRDDLKEYSQPKQLSAWSEGMVKAAEKMESQSTSEDVRREKQRMLDTKQHVKAEVRALKERTSAQMSAAARAEHAKLDQLSRAFTICTIAVGSGSESLSGPMKLRFGHLVLGLGEQFSDLWTRNRLRIDFCKTREEILADENIWTFMESADIGAEDFAKIKAELEMFLHGFAVNMVCEPVGRVLWTVSSTAGVPVLAPVIGKLEAKTAFRGLLRASWMLDADAIKGKNLLKPAIAQYKGHGLLRVVLANHLLWRVYWYHYRTAAAQKFIDSARRVLAPLGLIPSPEKTKQARLGSGQAS